MHENCIELKVKILTVYAMMMMMIGDDNNDIVRVMWSRRALSLQSVCDIIIIIVINGADPMYTRAACLV